MVLKEILSDIRLALAECIFTSGWAFGLVWSMVFYLIDKTSKNKREGDESERKRKDGADPL